MKGLGKWEIDRRRGRKKAKDQLETMDLEKTGEVKNSDKNKN
jgi:hypothetical protein